MLALSLLAMIATPAAGLPMYDSGALNFSTTGQSMWGPGAAFQASDSVFVGAEWQNRTAGVGGFVGSVSDQTVYTNPGWWAWKACVSTVNFLCGNEPSRGAETITVDTRTGARVDLTTSGKFGLEFGYTVDSGSVDASAKFSAAAVLPEKRLSKLEYFDFNPSDSLDDGTLSSQSPNAEAYINAIAQLSGSVTARACLITQGCTPNGTANLPTLDETLPVLSIDPNSLKVVPGALPAANPDDPRLPLAEVSLVNQTLTLQGALDASLVPGFKLTTSQFTIADTTPPTPDITLDLASLSFQLPVITTSGGLSGGSITSGGRSDFLNAKVDLDGVAALSGAIPPTGFGVTLIDSGGFKIAAQFDALDIDAGPDLGIQQDFELEPTLMVQLDFSNPVMLAGLPGLHDVWQGAWKDLPEIALTETTTFSPTWWIDAELIHTIGIDLGLSGTMDILKFGFTASAGSVDILSTNPISLNSLLGLGNELFATDKLYFPIWDSPFALGGFNTIAGASFTIELVPEPATVVLLLVGGVLLVLRRRRHGSFGGGFASALA